jgi:carboxyl-terminal processing protease
MKNSLYLLLIISLLFTQMACKKMWLGDEISNSQIENFDDFWRGMDENYVGFAARPDIDWDSIYRVYRPKVTNSTSNTELFTLFKQMMLPFRDEHFAIEALNTGYYQFVDTFNHQFLGLNAVGTYLTTPFKGNKTVKYAPIGKVGYIYIADFDGRNPVSYYELIDAILDEFKDQTGVIMDIRDNGGGNEAYAKIIASRFTDQSRVYDYNRFKKGKNRADLTDFVENTLDPKGNKPFLKPVMLLTNQQVGSSAENFALMMRSNPTIKTVGDNTAGLIYTRPIARQLPNGWLYKCSVSLLHDAYKKILIEGIVPDYRVNISSADAAAGKDKVLEKALALLK